MTMRVVIASDPDREDLFAEIQEDDQPWAEVSFDAAAERFLITIFSVRDSASQVFDLAEVETALNEARDELIRRGYSPTFGKTIS